MKRKEKIIVVMFSGGIDSTHMAYHALTGTRRPVHLHHINFVDRNCRWIPERIACGKITQWLADNTRAFGYSESTIDYTSMVRVGSDEDLVLLTAARLTLDFEETYEEVEIWEGTNKDDHNAPGMEERLKKRGTMESFFQRCCHSSRHAIITFPIIGLSKEEIIRRINCELLPLCWYCRTPNPQMGYGPCNTCITCKQIKEIMG